MDLMNEIAISFSLVTMFLLFLHIAIHRRRSKKNKRKEERALKGIAAGIGDRLHAAHPDSKWKWICCHVGIATNGGIARIEVLYISGEKQFMDVCVSPKSYMALHMLNVAELSAQETYMDSERPVDMPCKPKSVATAPTVGLQPHDEESVGKWFNIVLIDALTALIDDLNASGEVCLYIGHDGKAYVEENDGNTIVYDFGEMPDMFLWEHITDKLGEAGLFAEKQEGNRIFVSWAA